MIQMKTPEEIGEFIKSRMTDLNIKPICLAELLASAKDSTRYNKNDLRDLVYKWMRGDRTPGVDYKYYLSKILHVSIEELLVAGDICEKYDNRPFTLYAIAKSNNFRQLDEIMTLTTPDGTCVGTNYDEYDKTILDENIEMLKYMIEKQYLQFCGWGSFLVTHIRIGNYMPHIDMFYKIVNLAIKYDDAELISLIIAREYPIWIQNTEENNIYKKLNYQDGYEFDTNILISILNTKNIFNYFTTPYTLNEEQWNLINRGIYYMSNTEKSKCLNEPLSCIERLPFAFNLLLDLSKRHNKIDLVKHMEKIGSEHNKNVLSKLYQFYTKDDLKVDQFGTCQSGTRGSLSVLANIPNNPK